MRAVGRRRSQSLIAAVAQVTVASWVGGLEIWERGPRWSTNPFYPSNDTPTGTSYDVRIAGATSNALLTTDLTVNSVDVSGGRSRCSEIS